MIESIRKLDIEDHITEIRNNQLKNEKLSETDFKSVESERNRIKTLPGAPMHEIEKVKKELKAMLPRLKPSEVRRFHLPPDEAVIDELEEYGYERSIEYLKELFNLDEETRKEAGPGTLIWKRPRLRENKDALMRLKEGLMVFERAQDADLADFANAGDLVSVTMVFLHMALYFQAMTWEWWWVAERLYRSALVYAELIKDNERMITLTRYLLGRFLFEQMQDTVESMVHLNIARKASQTKSWTAANITDRKEMSVYRECNVFLYKALLVYAQEIAADQPDAAVEICTEALIRAVDSELEEHILNALFELGKAQLRSTNVKASLKTFSKLLAIAKRIPDPEGICKAHLALASAYKEVRDEMNTEKHLQQFREQATAFELPKELAQAHYSIGEHFLSKRRPDIATPHLEMSFSLYNSLDLIDEANKARIIAGVSKGQGVLEQYIDLVLRCGLTDEKATLMLCLWKNRRTAFWTEELNSELTAQNPGSQNLDGTISPSLSTLTDITHVAKV